MAQLQKVELFDCRKITKREVSDNLQCLGKQRTCRSFCTEKVEHKGVRHNQRKGHLNLLEGSRK